jgi:hypothetical protein
VEKIKGSK